MSAFLCALLLLNGLISSQGVSVGDTVWYGASIKGAHCQDSHRNGSLLTCLFRAFCSAEGFIMDKLCIDRGTLLDKPSIKSLERPGEHSLHWYVEGDTTRHLI
jgi:hypothetical protein